MGIARVAKQIQVRTATRIRLRALGIAVGSGAVAVQHPALFLHPLRQGEDRVAAGSGQIAATAAKMALGGATSLLPIVIFAPAPSTSSLILLPAAATLRLRHPHRAPHPRRAPCHRLHRLLRGALWSDMVG